MFDILDRARDTKSNKSVALKKMRLETQKDGKFSKFRHRFSLKVLGGCPFSLNVRWFKKVKIILSGLLRIQVKILEEICTGPNGLSFINKCCTRSGDVFFYFAFLTTPQKETNLRTFKKNHFPT